MFKIYNFNKIVIILFNKFNYKFNDKYNYINKKKNYYKLIKTIFAKNGNKTLKILDC